MLVFDCGEFAAVYRRPRALATTQGAESRSPAVGFMRACEMIEVPKTIVLVGLMGAGKSCIGRRLAAELGVDFVDADTEIEAAAGCSIEEIFERHGEAAFRDGERRVIARLLKQPVHVLASGGGSFMAPQTRELIRRRAISIWLRADLELLLKRTARRDTRPLLQQGDPRAILETLIAERYPVYAEADIIVDSQDGPPEITVQRVLTALNEYLAERNDHRAEAGRCAEGGAR